MADITTDYTTTARKMSRQLQHQVPPALLSLVALTERKYVNC